MTCIERLRETMPWYSSFGDAELVEDNCPYESLDIGIPEYCCGKDGGWNEACERCWNRECLDPVPQKFLYEETHSVSPTKFYIEVLERRIHPFTHNFCYKIRRSCSHGWMDEIIVTDVVIRTMLTQRIDK